FIGGEPFAVLLGDDIMVSEPPALLQMMKLYEQSEQTIVGVQPVPRSEVNKYGIIASGGAVKGVHVVSGLVEKPLPQAAPSTNAIMGRYILKPSIFSVLSKLERGTGGEYQLTDALHEGCRNEGLLALDLQGKRYDIGDKFGYIQATLEIGLARKELRPQLVPYLRGLLGSLEDGTEALSVLHSPGAG
ncbi:sugar phosphate nucleotidyltransferase, partial [Paenibacillus graminis]